MRSEEPCSLRIYNENIIHELLALGVEIIPFSKTGIIPSKCDLVWDPGLAMRRIPKILKYSHAPVIATLHGVKAFSLPIHELTDGLVDRLHLSWLKKAVIYDWIWFKKKVAAVVVISKYGAEEVIGAFQLPENIVHVIYHGVNREIFNPDGEVQLYHHPYLFHVSSRNPIKNVQRIFAAYKQLPESCHHDLVAVLPDYRGKANIKGIHVIQRTLTQNELANWYRGALCFVFPSLRETFGMPVLEAMSCGCPVITSNVTGCHEIADNASLFVDPRCVEEITQAMKHMIDDESLRQYFRRKGIIHAEQYTWRKSAEKLLHIFKTVINKEKNGTTY